jgi:pilus assembly protein Flp/PilA
MHGGWGPFGLSLEAERLTRTRPHVRKNVMHPRLLKFQVKRPRVLDDRGATAVEYGLMVALIAIVIIGAVEVLGTNLSSIFDAVASSV